MTATCPSCGAEQSQSLLCHTCTSRLEKALGDVASIVADLDITMSRQDNVPSGGGGSSSPKGKDEDAGLSAIAHTRTPINFGAVQAGDNLANVLTTWARDVAPRDLWRYKPATEPVAVKASWMLLDMIDAIRRHPAVNEMVDEIHDAVAQARRVVDRPADRIYLGQCLVPTQDEEGSEVTCYAEIWASPSASAVQCKVCKVTHPVIERRAWLMEKAADMIVSSKEASSYLGEVGGIKVSQSSIRGYVHRGTLAYRAPVDAKRFRLGDLLEVLIGESERKSA